MAWNLKNKKYFRSDLVSCCSLFPSSKIVFFQDYSELLSGGRIKVIVTWLSLNYRRKCNLPLLQCSFNRKHNIDFEFAFQRSFSVLERKKSFQNENVQSSIKSKQNL